MTPVFSEECDLRLAVGDTLWSGGEEHDSLVPRTLHKKGSIVVSFLQLFFFQGSGLDPTFS